MSFIRPTQDSVAAGPLFTLLDRDLLDIARGTTLESTGATALSVSGNDVLIWVGGSVAAASSAIAATGTGLHLAVTDTGAIRSGDAASAILAAEGFRLDCFGTITATLGGAITLTGAGDLLNAGTITSALTVITGSEGADLVKNSGLLKSHSGSALALAGGDDVFVNSGRVVGSVMMGAGNDVFRMGPGLPAAFVNGVVSGEAGDDLVEGSVNRDRLFGGQDKDVLLGRSGDDFLSGDSGADTLHGGDGNDRLLGGAGADSMLGGAGADTFIFSEVSKTNGDLVSDFTVGEDHLQLADNLIARGSMGDGSVDWKTLVIYVAETGVISGDANADGTVDWTITLTTKPALTYDDFIVS